MASDKDFLRMMEADAAQHAPKAEAAPERDTPRAALPEPRDDTPAVARYNYPIKGTLRTHQIRALNEADGNSGHCFWMDPGAGKTLTCIAEAGLLFQQGEIDGVLIFAPNGPHEQWIDEQFPLWADYEYRGTTNRTSPARLTKWLQAKPKGLGVFAINYDALRTPDGKRAMELFVENHPRFYLILDESQKIKAYNSQRTKEALKWSLRASYRRLLSGTPLLKGLEDLWSQYEACEAGLAWPHNPVSVNERGTVNTYGYIGYRAHYCRLAPVPNNPRGVRIVGYRNEDHLLEQTAGNSTRVMADEFMKGETPDFIPVRTPMNPEQRRHYNSMTDHLLALLDSGTVTAQNALVQMQKLTQIASGFMYQEDGEDEVISSNKISAAMDIIEQLSEPVIIWSPFIMLKDMMVRRLDEEGLLGRVYVGTQQLDDWKQDPQGILIGNQGSGLGVGMNLQHAAANIYLANSFSSEARWQSVKRTDRIGQTRQVRVWDLIAPDTVDEKVMKSLSDKEDISRRTIDQLRDMM